SQKFWPRARIFIPVCALVLATFGLCAHQGYVEFFKFQLEPFHLRYVTDWQFVTSNSGSFWELSNFLLLGISALTIWALFFNSTWPSGLKFAAWSFGGVVALSLFAHNRNIRYRVQWFIPENLQTNVLETLYLRGKSRASGKNLTPSDYA